MNSTFSACGLLGAISMFVLAGCGSSAAPTPTAVTSARAVPTPTRVPAPNVGFAQRASPILQTSVGEVQTLLAAMNRPDFSTLGDLCSQAGGDLSNARTGYTAEMGFVPKSAVTIHRQVMYGFKVVLFATDECGNAADTASKKDLKTAQSDMRHGLAQLRQVEGTISRWNTGGA